MADSPAFQFYAADFLADENQRVMTPAEAGAYIRLICTCWIEGSIPDDVRRLAPLAGMTRAEMQEAWPQIVLCFEEHPDEPGRLVHPRVERERQKQRTYAAQMAKAGEKGARRRWGKKKAKEAAPDKDDHGQAIATPSESDSQAIARPSIGGTKLGEDRDEPTEELGQPKEKTVFPQCPEPLRHKASDSQAMPTPMASDGSPSSSSSLEESTTSRPPVTRSAPDSQAMAGPSDDEAGKREGENEDRPAKPKHPELDRLWTGGMMDEVLEGWHQGQERVELANGKSIGIGLEYWLFNDLLHATGDPDVACWIVTHAPQILGWPAPRTLYWALRGQNFDTATAEYIERHPPERDPTAGMVTLKRIPSTNLGAGT